MKLVSLGSGSSGNCSCIGCGAGHLLVDAGLSKRRVEERMAEIGLAPADLSGILITHEHIDHIRALGALCRSYQLPVFATEATWEQIAHTGKNPPAPEFFHKIEPDHDYQIGGLSVHPFHIDHDAADPVAYRISAGGSCAAVATDIGVYHDYTVDNLRGLNALLLESNHDVRMLESGPYPYRLKQPILGNGGHFSK